MRLLHTKRLTFQEFLGSEIPKYAILSHRWGKDEVSYQEFQAGSRKQGQGYEKIIQFCSLAASRRLEWAWVDTCCIDKTSSAELTESINSMWSWYENAEECYAYLGDLPSWVQVEPDLNDKFKDAGRLSMQGSATLCASKWFQRGWTLQELLAPMHVFICNEEWGIIGSKAYLSWDIKGITGIQEEYILDPYTIRTASVARRMSWAANRETTRIEDRAYCLLGLFGVNMPMLYGEGENAFLRLQKKIIKVCDDESIFAWRLNTRPSSDLAIPSGMLAHSPQNFQGSENVVELDIPPELRLQYQMTNRGLELKIPSSLSNMDIPDRPRNLQPIEDNRQAKSVSTSPRIRARLGRISLDNEHEQYTSTSTKLPKHEDRKRFQLACGIDRTLPEDTHETINTPAMRSVIGITLERSGNHWQRADARRWSVWPEFGAKSTSSRSLYYVPQIDERVI